VSGGYLVITTALLFPVAIRVMRRRLIK
jgi:hypothetical protein